MRGLEITINGKRVCTAGLAEHGVLSANLTWLHQSPEAVQEPNKQTLTLDVGAFVSEPSIPQEHLKWLAQPLQVGDVVEIRIVEADEVDAPSERRPDDPGIVDRLMRRYYEQLKRAYGDTSPPRLSAQARRKRRK